jgi:uncharacterized protein (TIGR00304 family)
VRPLTVLAWSLVAVGAALLAAAAARGEATVFLVFVVPVFQSSSPLALLGVAALFAGFLLGFWSLSLATLAGEGRPPEPPSPAPREPALRPRKRFGGVILLGPIPLVFASDRRLAAWMLVLGLALALLLLVLFLLPFLLP